MKHTLGTSLLPRSEKAYREITKVYVLPKLINFTESIHPYLNDASKTPGWQKLKKKVCLQEITDTFKADFSALTLLFCVFQDFKDSLIFVAFTFAKEM